MPRNHRPTHEQVITVLEDWEKLLTHEAELLEGDGVPSTVIPLVALGMRNLARDLRDGAS
jgi:hypothetical protein